MSSRIISIDKKQRKQILLVRECNLEGVDQLLVTKPNPVLCLRKTYLKPIITSIRKL